MEANPHISRGLGQFAGTVVEVAVADMVVDIVEDIAAEDVDNLVVEDVDNLVVEQH